MRICFASDQAFPAVGGEGISTQNFSLGMAKRGHTVIVLTSQEKLSHYGSGLIYQTTVGVRSKSERYSRSGLFNAVKGKGIRIYRFFSLLLPGQKGSLAFPSSIKITSILKKERINLVQINLPSYLGWQTLRGARKIGIPVVLGFHVQVGNIIPFYFPFSLLLFYKVSICYLMTRGDVPIVAKLYRSGRTGKF